jgi:hypothetical protein
LKTKKIIKFKKSFAATASTFPLPFTSPDVHLAHSPPPQFVTPVLEATQSKSVKTTTESQSLNAAEIQRSIGFNALFHKFFVPKYIIFCIFRSLDSLSGFLLHYCVRKTKH